MNQNIAATHAQQMQAHSTKTFQRINSIDLLRGLIMIIMALDHTRDYFHTTAWTDDPLNLQTTTPALFFTRWITHVCAPNFVFLAGTSAWFQSLRKSKKELSIFLIKRGVWLIFVDLFIFNFAFSFDPTYTTFAVQTLWAIGIGMFFLGLAVWLPFTAIFAIGIIIVFGHNLLDFYERGLQQPPGMLYDLLHHQGQFQLWQGHSLLIFYPALPWIGLMLLGYCFGKLFLALPEIKREKILLWLGIGLLLFFVIVRFVNVYGDPVKWSTQKDGLYTFLSFIKVNKYPPSLLYMCVMVGLAMIFLGLAAKTENRVTKFITVYGRVPFLFYIVHFFLLHFIAMIIFFVNGHTMTEAFQPTDVPGYVIPGQGFSLWVVYFIWIAVVLSLYPMCRWFSQYKRTHKNWWLGYL
jgi:uncharacterized membrane protein